MFAMDEFTSKLMDRAQHAAPAGACRKVFERVEDSQQALPERARGIVAARGIHGPVDKKWAAHDGAAVHEASIAAVGAAVAIVAHGENLARRDHQLVALNVLAQLLPPAGFE